MARIDPVHQRATLQNLQGHVLALQGRGRDTKIAHVTPQELVIPARLQTPEFMAHLERIAMSVGIDPRSLRVGSRRGKINPRTGHQEFDDDDLSALDYGGLQPDFLDDPGDDTEGAAASDVGDSGSGEIIGDDGKPIEGITVTASPDTGSHWWDDLGPIGTAMAGEGSTAGPNGDNDDDCPPAEGNGNPPERQGPSYDDDTPEYVRGLSDKDLWGLRNQVVARQAAIEPLSNLAGEAIHMIPFGESIARSTMRPWDSTLQIYDNEIAARQKCRPNAFGSPSSSQ
jgi:hypothetical protein